ncbi:MAG: hypothetical protein CL671_05005 [Balneola sp.]|nr:hypothetical protein [Balneola sp.]|tara:strand:+ start:59493 stop:64595 length:5103 start_codon:yes stop_codon:yes gene_type:complete
MSAKLSVLIVLLVSILHTVNAQEVEIILIDEKFESNSSFSNNFRVINDSDKSDTEWGIVQFSTSNPLRFPSPVSGDKMMYNAGVDTKGSFLNPEYDKNMNTSFYTNSFNGTNELYNGSKGVFLEFEANVKDKLNLDKFQVILVTNSGASQEVLYEIQETDQSKRNGWKKFKIDLRSKINNKNFRIYFFFTSNGISQGRGVFIDNVRLYKTIIPSLLVDRSNVEIDSKGTPYDVGLVSNLDWSATSNSSWLSVSPSSGSGNGTIELDAKTNPSSNDRSGKVTISGGGLNKTVTVLQKAKPTISASPSSYTFTAWQESKTFSVSTNSSSWSITSKPSWVTISNKTSTSFKATASQYKNSTRDRDGVIKVTSSDGVEEEISITQEKEQITVSPNSIDFEYNSNSQSFTVTSNTKVEIVTNDSDWATIRDSNFKQIFEILGTKTVYLVPERNNSSDSRTGRIRFRGQSGSVLGEISFEQEAKPVSIPPAPVLKTPSNGAINQSLSVTLDWDGSSGATSYEVQVSKNSNASAPFITKTVTETKHAISGLTHSTKYYWRVRAKNSAGPSSWSSRNFTTKDEPSNPPSKPTLSSPDNGARDQELRPTLDWNSVSNVSSYELQVSTNSSFTSTVVSKTGLSSSVSQYQLSSGEALDYEKTYYWRVQARNSDGGSGWTTPRNFTTEINSPAPIIIVTSSELKFGEVEIGQTFVKEYLVKGTGLLNPVKVLVSNGYEVSKINSSSGFGKETEIEAEQANSGKKIWVKFSPNEAKEFNSSLTLNSIGAVTKIIGVSGKGVVQPQDVDLIVAAIDHKPDNPIAGELVDIEVIIQNRGTLNSGSFKWKLMVNDKPVNEFSEAGLNRDSFLSRTLKIDAINQGTNRISVEVDSQDEVQETNEVNNIKTYTFEVREPIDDIETSLIANINQSPNSEFQVDIEVGSESDPVSDLYGMSYVVTYDPAILEVVGNQRGNFLGSNATYFPNDDPSNGEFAVGITKNGSQSGSNGTGIISSVSFKVNPNISSDTKTTIRLTEIDAENSSQQKIPFSQSEVEIDISTGIIVWPGDTNNDGEANQKDVLPLGRYWQQTGLPRDPASSEWKGQLATPWNPEEVTYADTNGDGVVDQKDVLPIGRNWQKMHFVNSTVSSKEVFYLFQNGNPPMSLTTDDQVELNSNFVVSVEVGNSDSTLTDVFGSSYEVNYDPEFVEYVSDESGDFLGSSPVYFAQNDSGNGSIGIGISRTSGSSSGFGELSTVTFKLIKEIPEEGETVISLSEVEVKDVNDDDILVSPRDLIIKGKPASIVTFSLPDTTALLSNEITLQLNISNPDGGAFSSFEIDLGFDTSLLELKNVEKGGLTGEYSIEFNSTGNNPGVISGQGTSDITTSGNLLNLTFSTIGNGKTDVSFNEILLNEGSPATNSISGSVDVASYVCGDADGNGIVSANDAADVLKHTVFLAPYPITGVDSSAADVTGNGMITAYDGSQILKFDVKILDILNCGLTNQKIEPSFASIELREPLTSEGDEVQIPLSISNITGDISSLEFSFDLSSSISDMVLRGIPENWTLSSNTDRNRIYYSLYGLKPISENTEMSLSIRRNSANDGLALNGEYRINENSKEKFESVFIQELPTEVSLLQNYPNPFNPTTNISYNLPEKAQVRLEIYSALGQKIATLVNESVVAGSHTVVWDAQNNASGIYFFRLFVGDVIKTQKMLLIK